MKHAIQRILPWLTIFRMGLVQMALGSIVVLTTSTINRVMVVELQLAAMIPGALVGVHYVLQILRPRWGYGSDVGGRRTPWIIIGMTVLAVGGFLSAVSAAVMADSFYLGAAVAVLAFVVIGCGVGAAGTSLLVLLAIQVDATRRPAAATIVWLMMIAGMAVTATIAGGFLDPFSFERLITVTASVGVGAVLIASIAIWGVETKAESTEEVKIAAKPANAPGFIYALRDVLREPASRHFAIFVFVSMLAYSAQDLILEPFAGAVFGFTPGESTKLSGIQHGGVFLGMILVAVIGTAFGKGRFGSMRAWAVGGCIASALCLAALASAGSIGPAFPLVPAVFLLGVANGAFAVAAIGSMMAMVREGTENREGTRMGLWGAAQALAFGLGGFAGTAALDAVRYISGSQDAAFTAVFALEAVLFLVSAYLAVGITKAGRSRAIGVSHEAYST